MIRIIIYIHLTGWATCCWLVSALPSLSWAPALATLSSGWVSPALEKIVGCGGKWWSSPPPFCRKPQRQSKTPKPSGPSLRYCQLPLQDKMAGVLGRHVSAGEQMRWNHQEICDHVNDHQRHQNHHIMRLTIIDYHQNLAVFWANEVEFKTSSVFSWGNVLFTSLEWLKYIWGQNTFGYIFET